MTKFKIKIGLFAALALVSCTEPVDDEKESRVAELPYYDEASFTPKWLSSDSPELKDFHQIPAFSLQNQNGETITEKSVAGKIYVTNFFFATCGGICPKMTSNMSRLQAEFVSDQEIILLSHSVTPAKDSVEALHRYAEINGIQAEKWHLLTGDRSEIYNLGRNSYMIEEDLGLEKNPDDFLHTENFVLIDQNRHIRGIYNGLNNNAIDQLISDIRTLKLN